MCFVNVFVFTHLIQDEEAAEDESPETLLLPLWLHCAKLVSQYSAWFNVPLLHPHHVYKAIRMLIAYMYM